MYSLKSLARLVVVPLLGLTTGVTSASTIAGSTVIDGRQVTWQSGSRIVTTIDPSDVANYSAVHGQQPGPYSGIAALLIERDGGVSICTGSLVNSFQLVTAAHCVADGSGNLVASSIDSIFLPESGGQYVDSAASVLIHPDYSGSVFDDHDIAVVNLGAEAPAELTRYGLYFDPAVGEAFETVGFGRRGQGDTGATIDAGTRVQGFNQFDALGIELLPFLGVNSANSVLLFDFDNGLEANDAFSYWLGPAYFGLGLGIFESNTAPGDSGGPSFINGRIAAVTSFGLTFSASDPDTGEEFSSDVLAGLNSSFGEFSGNTSIAANQAWLDSVLIPEPSAFVLMATGLFAIGWLRRSRRPGSQD